MRINGMFCAFVLLCVSLGGLGCEKQPDSSTKAVAQKVSTDVETDLAIEKVNEASQVALLSLAPENPTVKDDLRVLVHGYLTGQEWQWEVNGETVEEATGPVLPKQFFSKGDLVTAAVLSDGTETSISTSIGNSPPQVLSVPFIDSAIHRGVDIQVEPEASDDDGDNVEFRYVWSLNGEPLSWVDGPLLAGDQFQKGDIVKLTVFPFDGEDEGPPFKGLELEIPNAPPAFISLPPDSFKAVEYRYQARAEDPDEEPVVYQLSEGPEGMGIDAVTGLISWTLPKAVTGEVLVRIEASDPEGMKVYQEYTLQINRGE